MSDIQGHRIVSREEWLATRTALLAKEKELTRLGDELSRERRQLPCVKVDDRYVFDGPRGRVRLADLFGPHGQLLVYHFMFSPDWDAGCKHCSFWADSFDGIGVHLAHRDVSFVAVSRAPFPKLDAFRRRMGWSFPWFSSFESDFNHDFGVSFTAEAIRDGTAVYNYAKVDFELTDQPGLSAFVKDDRGAVFHTYSAYARGIESLNCAYALLDLAPKGRDEGGLTFKQAWVRYHDAYGD